MLALDRHQDGQGENVMPPLQAMLPIASGEIEMQSDQETQLIYIMLKMANKCMAKRARITSLYFITKGSLL